MIEIYHLIYTQYKIKTNNLNLFQKEGLELFQRVMPRKEWFKHLKTNKLPEHVFYYKYKFELFMDTLKHFYNKWYINLLESLIKTNEDLDYIELTYGFDEETGICAIAITHPHDNYNKKIGRAIVEGRIKRQRGELDNGTRDKYHPLPNYIYDPSVEG